MELRSIKINDLINLFPDFPIKGELLDPLSYFNINKGSYVLFSLLVSLPTALLNILLFPLSFSILLLLPKILFNKMLSSLNNDLPYFLRAFAIFLETKKDYDEAYSLTCKLYKDICNNISRFPFLEAQLKKAKLYGNVDFFEIANNIELSIKFKQKDAISFSSFLSLFFIAVYVIVPTFLLILYKLPIIDISEQQISFILFLAVPAISLLMILINGSIRFEPLYSSLFVFLYLLYPSPLFLFLAVAIQLYFFYKNYKYEKQIDDAESKLPSLLISASSLTNPDMILTSFSKENYFSFFKQIKTHPTDKILELFIDSERSDVIKRAFNFILIGYRSGYNLQKLMLFIVEDIMKFLEYKRNKEASLSIQKYTILFSAILLPVIFSFSNSLSYLSANDTNTEHLIIPYLLIFSIFSSLYVYSISSRRYVASLFSLALFVLPISLYYLLIFLNPF